MGSQTRNEIKFTQISLAVSKLGNIGNQVTSQRERIPSSTVLLKNSQENQREHHDKITTSNVSVLTRSWFLLFLCMHKRLQE